MSQFKPYPAYKDSGVEWLGKIPAHWNLEPLKHSCNVFPSNVDKKSYEDQEAIHLCNYTDVYYNERIVAGMDFMPATATHAQIEKFSLRAGDVIFTKDSESAEDIAIATYVPADIPKVICGYHLSMIRPSSRADGSFIKYFFDSAAAKAYFFVSANGLTRVGLGQYATDNVPTPIAPLLEQIQIARFLDHETARIDGLIEEQKRLIELLKEKRQAVISHAVTKGLDANVPMKDSGVEWLGEVPAHWKVSKLTHYARIMTGFPFPSASFSHDESDTRLLRGANIGIGTLKWDDTVYWRLDDTDHLSNYLMEEGQIVLGMDRPWISGGMRIARVSSEDIPCLLLQRVAAISPNIDLDNAYLYLLLASELFKEYIEPDLTGVSVPHISPEQIMSFQIPVPSIDEQRMVSSFINRQLDLMSVLFKEANESIKLLQERRSALISAAVTGKIDVRNWQAPTAAPQAQAEKA